MVAYLSGKSFAPLMFQVLAGTMPGSVEAARNMKTSVASKQYQRAMNAAYHP